MRLGVKFERHFHNAGVQDGEIDARQLCFASCREGGYRGVGVEIERPDGDCGVGMGF